MDFLNSDTGGGSIGAIIYRYVATLEISPTDLSKESGVSYTTLTQNIYPALEKQGIAWKDKSGRRHFRRACIDEIINRKNRKGKWEE
jgi:lambda repressor-like predicted transcriptional regulator